MAPKMHPLMAVNTIDDLQGNFSEWRDEVGEYRMAGYSVDETACRFIMAPAVVRQIDRELQE